MISVEEAQTLCLDLINSTQTHDEVRLENAAGRVLSAPAYAKRAQPPFSASAMDGYALRHDEAKPGASFTVIGEAAAGHFWPSEIGPGQALRIFTGAPVPDGADHVVIQEDVQREGDRITILPKMDKGRNIRAKGSDFAAGFELAAPKILTASDLALLAAMNVAKVSVSRRPKVTFLATGDELVMPGDPPKPDQITASNIFALKAIVEQAGGQGYIEPIAPDDKATLTDALKRMSFADIIVTVGGASVGDYDLVGQAAADLGLERAFYKIAMRPGKPLIAGRFPEGTPYLGLPGNPVSAIVCAYVFLVPMIHKMLGLKTVIPEPRYAKLVHDIAPNGNRQHYMRAFIEGDNIRTFERQDSSLLSIMTQANALLIRPIHDPAQRKGQQVAYLPLW